MSKIQIVLPFCWPYEIDPTAEAVIAFLNNNSPIDLTLSKNIIYNTPFDVTNTVLVKDPAPSVKFSILRVEDINAPIDYKKLTEDCYSYPGYVGTLSNHVRGMFTNVNSIQAYIADPSVEAEDMKRLMVSALNEPVLPKVSFKEWFGRIVWRDLLKHRYGLLVEAIPVTVVEDGSFDRDWDMAITKLPIKRPITQSYNSFLNANTRRKSLFFTGSKRTLKGLGNIGSVLPENWKLLSQRAEDRKIL